MSDKDRSWNARMSVICETLKARGVIALPSHETHSCLLLPAVGDGVNKGRPDWEHIFTAPEVFISDDELAAEDYKEIVLRKVTSALGRVPHP
jgi:hypothetical protein